MEELFNEIDMREDHASTAVSLQLELIQGISFADILGQEFQVLVPLVSDDLSA